jgi:ABC-type oligopeptide transport system substrate-binding subunit
LKRLQPIACSIASGRLAALALTVALAACGERNAEHVKNPDVADVAARDANRLVRALGGEPETLDPRQAADNPSLSLMLDLYEGLTAEAADGTIIPGAAERWSVSQDGRTWIFTLRPGLQWSDGKPLTATEFAQGIAEAKSADSSAPYKELLEGIHSILVTSDTELTINVWRPLPYLPALLSLPVAAPERAARKVTDSSAVSAASDANANAAPTNGPYRLVSHRPNERIELERNPHFHSAANVAVERVTYLTLEDLNTELNLYRSGQLDVTSEVPNSRVEWIEANLPGELQVAPYLSTYGYAIDLARVPDPGARVALAMAIDRDAIVGKVTGAGERAATGWVPPGFAGYVNAAFDWKSVAPEPRRARAAQLWSNGWPGPEGAPERITLCTDASENHHRTAVALADQWQSVLGIDVELVEMEWKAYLARREQPEGCDLLRFGWSADYVDPEGFLTLFESRHPQNAFDFSDRRFDEAMYASRRAPTSAERMRRLAEAEALLLEAMPVVPVFHRVTKRLVHPRVEGYVPNPLGHLPSRHLLLKKEGGKP